MSWNAARAEREAALAAVEPYLEAEGFQRSIQSPLKWRGKLSGIECSLQFTDDFPFALPKLHAKQDGRRIVPHVDATGSVCVATNTAILLDATNPVGLVREVLQRGRIILARREGPPSSSEIAEEYEAYWSSSHDIHSLCQNGFEPRPIVFCRALSPIKVLWTFASDTEDQLKSWLSASGFTPVQPLWKGYFVPLAEPLPLERYGDMRVAELCRKVRSVLAPASTQAVLEWSSRIAKLPAWCVFSFPVADGRETGAVGAVIPPPRSMRGNRASKLTIGKAMLLAAKQAIDKHRIVRLDPDYLRPRGGVRSGLNTSRAILVGAGAVGGFVAKHLVMAGVASLHIIDNDDLKPENAHRHLLGMHGLGKNKALALRDFLRSAYPHANVTCEFSHAIRALENLAELPDITVLATGDLTLELRISCVLRQRTQLIHVWLEPYEIGHHVLVDGNSASGCLRCLFRDEGRGLENRASFVAPGQEVARTMAGCHGAFVSFPGANADRAAIDVLERVNAPTNGTRSAVLLSRFGSAEGTGLVLSPRASMFRPGEVRIEGEFVSSACPICRT